MLELERILELLAEKCYNRTAKKMASELKPCFDFAETTEEIEKTSAAFDLALKYGSPSFNDFADPNIACTLAKAGRQLSIIDLLNIGKLLASVDKFLKWYGECSNTETALSYKINSLENLSFLKSLIENAIVDENTISDSASTTLSRIRREKIAATENLRNDLGKILKIYSKYLQNDNITIRDGRLVLPVKSEYRAAVNGIIHDTSKATVFTEPTAVVEANNNIRMLEIEELNEIERILAELSMECGQVSDKIIQNFNIYSELCLYFAKAKLAVDMNAFAPKLTRNGGLKLKNARHPLLFKKAVPINIEITDETNVVVITGSNMGGKTVALKTAGLLSLMLMCGLLIPADEKSEVCVFSKIFADIDSRQNIEQNLSTFSASMLNICKIIENSDKNTLVLIDELCSGTDPAEGASLATAIIENLRKKGTKVILTTHFEELKIFALQTDGVVNASFEFDINNLSPTYKLNIGTPGSSYAFAISEKLGLPTEIIQNAIFLLENETKRFNDVIAELEIQRKDFEKKTQELEKIKAKLEEQLENQRDYVEICEREIENARKKAENIVDTVKAKSNNMLTELEKLIKQQNKSAAEHLIEDTLADISGKISPPKPVQNLDIPVNVKIGDNVLLLDRGSEGVVITDISNGQVFVQMGAVRTKTPVNNLKILPPKPKNSKKPERKNTNFNRTAKSELDIRGTTASEGVLEIERFINDAVLANKYTICIIHGRGTGVLRDACHRKLKSLSAVKSFRLGVYGEGGDGVTIVTLA
jgi:DNA mismatch repair protein MutS2